MSYPSIWQFLWESPHGLKPMIHATDGLMQSVSTAMEPLKRASGIGIVLLIAVAVLLIFIYRFRNP